MTTPRPEALTAEGTCWFCKGAFVVDALIAGYDTFDEQRLACLACNERMQGNWSLATALAPLPGTCGCTCCLGHLVLVSARYECNGGCGCSASPAGLPRQKAKRIDWSNVVVDEGDEAP